MWRDFVTHLEKLLLFLLFHLLPLDITLFCAIRGIDCNCALDNNKLDRN